MDVHDEVARYWDTDSATYDRARGHVASSATERAAWSSALERHLPAAPSVVLDVGAGTGFLALAAARLGHRVTALDLSEGMLAKLRATAEREALAIDVVVGRADEPPDGPFDAVIERHLIWTLPDPGATVAAWRRVAPSGVLLLFEGLWGEADLAEARRARLRERLRRLRRVPSDHHAQYDPALRDRMPLGRGTHPDRVLDAVEAAGWGPPRVTRLRDVEWARQLHRRPAERLLGVTPQFVVRGGGLLPAPDRSGGGTNR